VSKTVAITSVVSIGIKEGPEDRPRTAKGDTDMQLFFFLPSSGLWVFGSSLSSPPRVSVFMTGLCVYVNSADGTRTTTTNGISAPRGSGESMNHPTQCKLPTVAWWHLGDTGHGHGYG
jgi:hypothetical protein